MKSIKFEGFNFALGKHQPQYETLFANVSVDTNTPVEYCLKFADDELADIVAKNTIVFRQMTSGDPLHTFQGIRLGSPTRVADRIHVVRTVTGKLKQEAYFVFELSESELRQIATSSSVRVHQATKGNAFAPVSLNLS